MDIQDFQCPGCRRFFKNARALRTHQNARFADLECRPRNCPCADCGVETLPTDSPDRAEFYMVEPGLWDAQGIGQGYLCIGCLETRLGRELEAADFIVCTVNDLTVADTPRYAWSWRTPRLTARLSA